MTNSQILLEIYVGWLEGSIFILCWLAIAKIGVFMVKEVLDKFESGRIHTIPPDLQTWSLGPLLILISLFLYIVYRFKNIVASIKSIETFFHETRIIRKETKIKEWDS